MNLKKNQIQKVHIFRGLSSQRLPPQNQSSRLDERNLPQKKPFNQSSRLDERNLPQKKPFVGIQEREPASCGLVLCIAEPGSATDSEARFLKGIPSILRIPTESLENPWYSAEKQVVSS